MKVGQDFRVLGRILNKNLEIWKARQPGFSGQHGIG
jgi:hypothetical protein